MILRIISVALLVTLVTAAPQKQSKDGSFQLIILHNNDMHARFEQTGMFSDKCKKDAAVNNKCYGGFARVAHEVREYRKKADNNEIPPVLYLNAGDTYTGTPWFSLYKNNITADFLNILKPDAISLGNHEFDEGIPNLVHFFSEITFPVLSANLDLTKEPTMQVEALKKSHVFTIKDRKIGVIGYLTPDTKFTAIPNGVEYIDEVIAINTEATKLKADGVNIIVALGHSGIERDKQIAALCPDIDLVIGGHSHTFLYSGKAPDWEDPEGEYPINVIQSNGKKVPVVQCYAFTKYLGYLHLEFDDGGNLIEIDGTPILLNADIPRDSDVLALLELYRPGITSLENDIVGQTKVRLDGNCRRKECNLGNFITDSFVDWYANNFEAPDFWTDAAIGLLQGGGVRTSIDHKSSAGIITKEDAATVLPFVNKIVIVEITGKELMEAFEHSVFRYTEGTDARGEFLQMSGAQVEYDLNRAPGKRVVEAKVLCAKCYVPELIDIVMEDKYRILMQDFLAEGGDGFDMFKGKTVKVLDIIDLDIFVIFLKKKSPIHPAVEWRVTVKDVMLPANDIVGTTKVMLDGNCREAECNLGNFIADSMVDWHSLKYNTNDFWTDASLAIIQGSRIKRSFDSKVNAGVILKADAIKVFQPAFFNIVLVEVTGQQLMDILEYSVENYIAEEAKNVEFLQLSGIQVTYNLSKPPGTRIASIKVLCSQCYVPELEPVDKIKVYKILMQSILAAGADGFNKVLKNPKTIDLQESDVNVFMEYLKKKSPVHPAVEWRITIINEVDETTTSPEHSSTVPNVSESSSTTEIGSTNIPPSTTQGASSINVSFSIVTICTILSLYIKM